MKKSFKFISSITNKIGNLTNRKINNTSKNEFININNEKDIDIIIKKIKSILDSIKIQNNTERNINIFLMQNIEKLEKYFENIEKCILDFNKFNINLYKHLLEGNLIPLLTENINILYSNKISNIITRFLHKIIFLDGMIISVKNIKEEPILVSNQIVSSIKKIIFEFVYILKTVNIININSDIYNLIIFGILPFLNELFAKILKYSNFYYALMNNSSTININLELLLFDILYILFKFEYQIKDRASKALIRKNLLIFINNFKFQNRKELLKKLINKLITNLIEYYKNFILLSIKDLDDNYKLINNFPLDLSEKEIIQLVSDDTLSFLYFFDMISNNFLENDLKFYLIDLMYNTFLYKYILEEIINLSNDINNKARSSLLVEYLFFMSKSIKNYDMNLLLFYFFFGFNAEHNDIYDDDININNINFKNIISLSDYESIRAFFTLIIESKNTNLFILLIKTFSNLAKRIPYVFISKMISPYYLFYLNKKKASEKEFEETLENLTKKPEQISLLEIIKIIMPQNFRISPKNWIFYFTKNLELNYDKNITNLNQMNNSIIQDYINDSSLINKSDENNTTNISYNYKNMINISTYSFSDYNNNNNSLSSSRFTNLNESLLGNQILNENNENEENKFSYILNNVIYASRVKFFEILIKKFKKYVDNKYEENLYLSEFFIQVFSFMNPIGKSYEAQLLYYIYAWGAFAKKNNEKLFENSATGILYYIKNQIDKKILNNFSKEEINNFEYFINDNNYEIFNMNNDLNTELGKRIEFLKNIKLYNEIFKDFSSNIFSKILNDESNYYWVKGLKQNTKIN